MNKYIEDAAERADERVCYSVADKMVKKNMTFDKAFNKTINTLRKGMVESRKKKVKEQSIAVCKEYCQLWGIDFK